MFVQVVERNLFLLAWIMFHYEHIQVLHVISKSALMQTRSFITFKFTPVSWNLAWRRSTRSRKRSGRL